MQMKEQPVLAIPARCGRQEPAKNHLFVVEGVVTSIPSIGVI